MFKSYFTKKIDRIKYKKKNNEGFTLVELIVVIVILAILIGVTIGGIYMYVGKARKNTDLNNAKTIEKMCATVNTDETMIKYMSSNKNKQFHVEWRDHTMFNGSDTHYIGLNPTDGHEVIQAEMQGDIFNVYLPKVFPDGLPKCNTGKFRLTFTVNEDGTAILVKCEVCEGQ